VGWDTATRVTVMLSPRHSGRVEGLCGDFDGNYKNDFDDLQTGKIAATPNDFARLWKTSPSCPDPDIDQDFDPCGVRVLYSNVLLTYDQLWKILSYYLSVLLISCLEGYSWSPSRAYLLCPVPVGKRAINVAFVRLSVRP